MKIKRRYIPDDLPKLRDMCLMFNINLSVYPGGDSVSDRVYIAGGKHENELYVIQNNDPEHISRRYLKYDQGKSFKLADYVAIIKAYNELDRYMYADTDSIFKFLLSE